MLAVFLISLVKSIPLYMDYQVQEDYVPILGYHKIDEGETTSLLTKTELFRDQVDYLTNTAKCNWITMNRLSYYIKNNEKLPTNTCIMNFDDGIQNQYDNVICKLNEHKVPATYYIAIDNIGKNNYYMSMDLLYKLKEIGHDIEAHTLNHARLSDLTYEEQEEQIIGSKNKLKELGFNITTFAYPYGAYNDDTIDILKKSEYILGRDTSQDRSWKDIRTPVVSYNEDYLWHFYYIKPEGYTGEQLYNKIKYTGWWQIEDNYKQINDDDGDNRVSTSSSYLSTDTSYAIFAMYDKNDEISTQFLTKYLGNFTLDILLYNSTEDIGFDVKVDNILYTPESHHYMSDYSLKYTVGVYDYYNFYVNIENLKPGLHTLNIIKTNGKKIYLDKFRLFSNVNQDFSDIEYYKECNPETDDNCVCEEIKADPTCENGILKGDVCCLSSCGTCGGTGCSQREGGSSGCCGGVITSSTRYCDEYEAPCIIREVVEEPDPTCENGILKGDVCCLSSCGTCGGTGCGSREGGSSGCCSGTITKSGISCDNSTAPCIVS